MRSDYTYPDESFCYVDLVYWISSEGRRQGETRLYKDNSHLPLCPSLILCEVDNEELFDLVNYDQSANFKVCEHGSFERNMKHI